MATTGNVGKTGVSELWRAHFLAFAGGVAYLCLSISDRAHYVFLADAFVHGRLDVAAAAVSRLTPLDFTLFDGRFFWPLGPLPAVILMPFVAVFGPADILQSVLQVAISVAVAWAAWRLAVRVLPRPSEAPWFALVFCLGSVMLGLLAVAGSYYLAQSLAVLFILLAFLEGQGRDRPEIIGTWLALAALSRWMALLAAVFFLAEAVISTRTRRQKLSRLLRLGAPLLAAWAIMAGYNWARFGSPFETGYGTSIMGDGSLKDLRSAKGLFSLANIPARLRDYFLLLPQWSGGFLKVDVWGLSAFLVMPVFLLVFRRPPARRREWSLALVAAGLQLVPLLLYYSSGAWQFGPRYLSDLMPALFFALLLSLGAHPLATRVKTFILASVSLNILFLFAFLRNITG